MNDGIWKRRLVNAALVGRLGQKVQRVEEHWTYHFSYPEKISSQEILSALQELFSLLFQPGFRFDSLLCFLQIRGELTSTSPKKQGLLDAELSLAISTRTAIKNSILLSF